MIDFAHPQTERNFRMKLAIFVAVVLCVAFPLHASAADQVFCTKVTPEYKDWVINTKERLKKYPGSVQELQLNISKDQQFTGVANRMAARANLLLDKDLAPNEIKAELYALCMSLT